MSVIIRLQNLPWSANAGDIREFFKGLMIPEGGVHIVGGEMGDAFIAFGSDEDARLAMQKTGGSLKGIQITLLLSSRTEMQKVIETARQQAMGLHSYVPPSAPVNTNPVQAGMTQNSMTNQSQMPVHVQPEHVPSRQEPQYHNIPASNPVFQSQPLSQPSNPPCTQPSNSQAAVGFMGQPMNISGSNQPFEMNMSNWSFMGNNMQHQSVRPNEISAQQNFPQVIQGVHPQIPSSYGQPQPSSAPTYNNAVLNEQQQHQPTLPHSGPTPPISQTETNSSTVSNNTNDERKSENQKTDEQSSSHRDKRESRSRDERRRRSKSRSRDRDRDRRRRSNRSRDRSRDRNTRRRRSRSRDRTRDNRDRERRDRDKERSRTSRDTSQRSKEDQRQLPPELKAPPHPGGIPGLGEIPKNIPKDGLSIYNPVQNSPIQTENNPSQGWKTVTNFSGPMRPFMEQNIRLTMGGSNLRPVRPPMSVSMQNDNRSNNPLPVHHNLDQEMSIMPLMSINPENNILPREPLLPMPREQSELGVGGHRKREFMGHAGPPKGDISMRETPDLESWNSRNQQWEDGNTERWPQDMEIENSTYSPEQFEETVINRGGLEGPSLRGGFRGRGRGGMDLLRPRGFRPDDASFRNRLPEPLGAPGLRGRPLAPLRGRGPQAPPDFGGAEKRMRTRCIEVLHVPFNASYKAIREIFSGIFMSNDCIKIISDENGRRIGVALIEFANTRDAYEAFKRSGSLLLDSKIMINFIDETFYHESVDIRVVRANMANNLSKDGEPLPMIKTPCLYVGGLPIGYTEFDVKKLFEQFTIERIVLEVDLSTRNPTGGCFLRFISIEECGKAFRALRNENIDGVAIKLNTCRVEELETAIQNKNKIYTPVPPNNLECSDDENGQTTNNGTSDSQVTNKNPNDLLTDTVVIRKVTSDINETSIRDFLSDEGLIPDKIYFNRPDSEGKTEVFVILPKISDVKRAVNKNCQKLGANTVTVEPVPKPTVMTEMGLPYDPLELLKKGQLERREIPESDKSNSIRSTRSVNKDQGNFQVKNESESRALVPNGTRLIQTPEPPVNFGNPGCVVSLGNVPYLAKTDDILYFFKNFKGLTPENVIRRYDEKNRPTADARVAFQTPQDARLAVQTLNRHYIGQRPIFLNLVE